MIIPATKFEQVFEIIQNFPKTDLMAFGFFSGDNCDNYKLLCKSPECYAKYQKQQSTDLIIMKITATSQLPLALSPFGPIHLSLTPEDGAEECLKIFNEVFEAHQDVIDTKKHPKKEKEE